MRRIAVRAAHVRADVPLIVLDTMCTVLSYLVILSVRFDGAVPAWYWDRFWRFVPLAVLLHLGCNWAWRLYGQMWRHASVNEARRVALAGVSAGTLVLVASALSPTRLPFSVLTIGALMVMALTGALRFQSRLFSVHRSPSTTGGLRIVIVGAGEAGAVIAREMLRSPEAGLVPVAFVDDDARKRSRSVLGVPVSGSTDELEAVVARHRAHQVLLAVPSASRELVRRVTAATDEAGIPLRTLPPVGQLLHGEPRVRDVRDVAIEDLLGRSQVETDLAQVSGLISGRRVLITGAGGSIGSEIARQVADFGPDLLVLLDHDETHLYDAGALLPIPTELELTDVCRDDELFAVFRRHRPQVVFHAAAHKHVPMLEAHPRQAVRTNVLGTANVARAAAAADVEHLVFISTDKAVKPTSIMGASKWLGEQIVLAEASAGRRWCAVRFGNVLGSRGSVIPTFARQIAAGGPVTVTDPRMTRFFMSTHEAVQLVLQASVLAEGGEVFELEMGQPVNILHLAERMIQLTGRVVGAEVPVRFTGVRPGEKLSEELHASFERSAPTTHPSILRLEPRRLAGPLLDDVLSSLASLTAGADDEAVAEKLMGLATDAWRDDLAIDLRVHSPAADELYAGTAP